nr:hypothetical protein [Methylobacterium sp. Leaf456]
MRGRKAHRLALQICSGSKIHPDDHPYPFQIKLLCVLRAIRFGRDVEDAGEVTVQVDQQALSVRVWRQDDPLDEGANQLGSFVAPLVVIEGVDQGRHLFPVAQRHVRMEEDRLRVLFDQKLGQFFATLSEGIELVLHRLAGVAFLDGFDDPPLQSVDLLQLGLIAVERGVVLHPQPVDVSRVLLAEDLHEFRVHQVARQRRQNGDLQLVLPDVAPVGADRFAFVTAGRAAEHQLGNFAETAAAAAAAEHGGEESLWPLLLPELLVRPTQAGLAQLHTVPDILIDDPELRHLLAYPLFWRIVACDMFPDIWILI